MNKNKFVQSIQVSTAQRIIFSLLGNVIIRVIYNTHYNVVASWEELTICLTHKSSWHKEDIYVNEGNINKNKSHREHNQKTTKINNWTEIKLWVIVRTLRIFWIKVTHPNNGRPYQKKRKIGQAAQCKKLSNMNPYSQEDDGDQNRLHNQAQQ